MFKFCGNYQEQIYVVYKLYGFCSYENRIGFLQYF